MVVIEKSKTGYGAYVPDLSGVGVVGKTRRIVKRLIKEAIELHLDDMKIHQKNLVGPTEAMLVTVGRKSMKRQPSF